MKKKANLKYTFDKKDIKQIIYEYVEANVGVPDNTSCDDVEITFNKGVVTAELNVVEEEEL